jgi:hypothetical protein
VTNSFQPKHCIQDLYEYKDDIINVCTSNIDLNFDNTMNSNNYIHSYTTDGNITINNSYSGIDSHKLYTIQPLTTSQISQLQTININSSTLENRWTINWNQDWEHNFPDWHRVNDMCSKYPGLKNAFDNFKTFYNLCKDDYDNPTPKK